MNPNVVIMAAGAAGEDVDLAGSWSSFWSAIKAGGGQNFTNLLNILAIFGMCLVAWAIIKWAWERRRGGGMGGGGGNGVTGALLVGVVLAAPNFILPAVLSVLDLVIDAVMKIWNNNGLK